MADLGERRVVEAQRMERGVIVTFDDGKCAVYTAELLYASLDLAELMSDVPCGDDSGSTGD